MNKKIQTLKLLILACVFSVSVDSFAGSAGLSDDALKAVSFIQPYHTYEILKRAIPQSSGDEITQYIILVASNDMLNLSPSVTTVQIESDRSWKALLGKSAALIASTALGLSSSENDTFFFSWLAAEFGYLVADSIVRRNVDLSQSWFKFVFPLGYFSNQSEQNSSITEIQHALVSGKQEIFMIVKERLFESVKSQTIKQLHYNIVE